MKKKKIALLGLTAIAGLSLASCGKKNDDSDKNESTSRTGYTYVNAPADEVYATDGGRLDIHVAYQGKAGITYQGESFINSVENKTFVKGTMLPTWTAFAEKTKTTIHEAATYSFDSNDTTFDGVKGKNFMSETDETQPIDLFFSTSKHLNDEGKNNNMVNLTPYIDGGKMPYLKAFLDKNPSIRAMLEQTGGAIYYTPYFDGYNETERMLNMDTQLVTMVLDDDINTLDTTKTNGGANADKNVVKKASYTPFINADYNYPSETTKIDVVNQAGTAKDSINVKRTTNIIKQQNELLNKGCTGKELAQQMRDYLQAAYGDYIGEKKLYPNYASIFTSINAAYNVDELIALMRVVKANPGKITGDANSEVECLIPRGSADNRIDNIADFMQVWGIQGMTAEKDMLYFAANGTLNDAGTTKATYDGLQQLAAIYEEGLILDEFWAKVSPEKGVEYLNKYWKKDQTESGYALMMYDYSATQSAGNDLIDGIGTPAASRKINYSSKGIMPILPPVTYWATETSWNHTQDLTNFTGKTLVRYAEENRSLKDGSWAIPSSSDNVEGAVRLMDYLYSPKGSMIQDFGPEQYWNKNITEEDQLATGVDTTKPIVANNISVGELTPVISTETLILLAGSGKDFWTFFRENIGATHGIGCIRSKGIQIEACNKYSQKGASNLSTAINLGVVQQGLVDKFDHYTWDTTVPTTYINSPSKEQANAYDAITKFWESKKKGSNTGWVLVVSSGKGADLSNTTVCENLAKYTYNDVLNTFDTKNKAYLYVMAGNLGESAIPEYSKAN